MELLDCARRALKEKKKIQFYVFGTLKTKKNMLPANIIIKGKYEEKSVYQDIMEMDIDFFWFPSPCPETYSYTLSIPIRLGIPVLGSNLGAIGERIQRHRWGAVYSWKLQGEKLLKCLTGFDYAHFKKGKLYIENTDAPIINDYYNDIIKVISQADDDIDFCIKEYSRKEKILNNIYDNELKYYLQKRKSIIKIFMHLNYTWVLWCVRKGFNRFIRKVIKLLNYKV